MWYNEITFEGKSIGNKPKKSFFKKLKEKVDNTKLEWYITQRHWKKGAENILKYLIKKVVKKSKKNVKDYGRNTFLRKSIPFFFFSWYYVEEMHFLHH